MHTRESIAAQLKQLGLKANDLVMLHASMRSIGYVLGGPDQVHLAIMDVLTKNGTLAMYVACDREYEAVGRNKLTSQEEKFILEHCPAFDPATARARRDHGILAEYFRSWPGVKSSSNPGARMCALGGKADEILANHPLNFGYGPDSPLDKIYQQNGKILLLGSDLDAITILHYAEHIAPIKEKRIENYEVPLLKEGKRIWTDVQEYNTSTGICAWPDRFFEKIMLEYCKANLVFPGLIGNANSFLVDAKPLVDFAVEMMIEESILII